MENSNPKNEKNMGSRARPLGYESGLTLCDDSMYYYDSYAPEVDIKTAQTLGQRENALYVPFLLQTIDVS